MIRRSFIKIGGDLAVDFANTAAPEGDRGSGLGSWRDLIDFLELMRRSGFPDVVVQDLSFTTGMGPDVYWAFVMRKPAA